jgi:hypothetical protein
VREDFREHRQLQQISWFRPSKAKMADDEIGAGAAAVLLASAVFVDAPAS